MIRFAWLAPAALLLAACSNTQLSSLSPTPSSTATTSLVPSATAPAVLDTLPITLTSTDQDFLVDAGEYSVEWSVAGGSTDCHFVMTALAVTPVQAEAVTLIETDVVGQGPVNGTTDFATVGAEYELHHTDYPEDPCNRQWSATITAK